MIRRIKRWIYSKLFLFDEEFTPITKVSSDRSCTRDAATRKRVAKAFEEQQQEMQSRAMKAHDATCEDPISCKKTICYQWAPDKIVKVEVIKRKVGRPKRIET